MSWRHELSENVWVEGTLRLEYGKSGIYNNNRLPAEEKEKEKEKKIPGIGRYPMGPTKIPLKKVMSLLFWNTSTFDGVFLLEKWKWSRFPIVDALINAADKDNIVRSASIEHAIQRLLHQQPFPSQN